MSGMDGFGTRLSRGDGATPVEAFVDIAGATNFSGPGISRETLDVSAHDSPNQYREFRGGIKDPGEISCDVNYIPTQHDVFVDDLDDEDPRNYHLTFPDGTVWEFPAILTGFEPTAPFDDKMTATITFKVSGKPVIVPSS
jgi:predicted secreted protein